MKKTIQRLSAVFISLVCIAIILNVNVTTRRGVNFRLYTIEMPLYLKILDFFDRHYNYQQLVKRIIEGTKTDEERIMRIFKWTHINIREVPEGLPVIDDHVWHIVVRGYGTHDQSGDVFTTLCNYAGVDAFFDVVCAKDQTSRLPFSFVRLNKKWTVFDPHNGVYFKNSSGGIATIDEMKGGDFLIVNIGKIKRPVADYKVYFDNLPSIKKVDLCRANIQSPLNRLIYQIENWGKKVEMFE